MNRLLQPLNRGPIFRMTHALGCWQQRRQLASWRRNNNRRAFIDETVALGGNPDPYKWISIGDGTEIQRHCFIWIDADETKEPKLTLGKRVFVGQGTHLSIMRPMAVGDNCLIGAYSYLLTNNHRFEVRTIPIRDQGYTSEPLVLAEDVWIGAHSVIMPGIKIGRGAIIGAGSVLTKNVGAYEIWAGIPAKKIKDRP